MPPLSPRGSLRASDPASERFRDRAEAGRALARALAGRVGSDALVLGLARGGVVVASEVAATLDLPLDVMVARKIGAPGQPEFGVGAIAPGNVCVLDDEAVNAVGATHEEIDQIVGDETAEMERRLLAYRGEPRLADVRGRDVILVDDGLATGVTARAAVLSLRGLRVRRLTFAAPVCARESAERLEAWVDEVVCLECPEPFRAVGLWYDRFDQTTDEEVVALLGERGESSPRAEAEAARGM